MKKENQDKKLLDNWSKVELMSNATILARQTSQTIGEKNDYYITLEQLNDLLMMMKSETQAVKSRRKV